MEHAKLANGNGHKLPIGRSLSRPDENYITGRSENTSV